MSEASQVVTPALRAINALPCAKAIKLHGSVHMEAGTPDILAVVDGRTYLLEAKLPGKGPEKIQERRLEQWASAGAIVGVIHSAAEALDIIRGSTP